MGFPLFFLGSRLGTPGSWLLPLIADLSSPRSLSSSLPDCRQSRQIGIPSMSWERAIEYIVKQFTGIDINYPGR